MARNNGLTLVARAMHEITMHAAALILFGATLAVAPTLVLAQQVFPTAEAAAEAFVDAVARSDDDAMRKVLGADFRRFIPREDVDAADIQAFLAAWARSHKMVPEGPDRALLNVGDHDWTLPIPIVRSANGWRFDMRAGADEIRTRRIGRDELDAMQAALAYFDAQKEYALEDRRDNGGLEYAQRFFSTPGKHDGLYWPTSAGEAQSPLGPLFGDRLPGHGYHGYYFKILTGQGKDAPGGAYEYVREGRMVNGFALIAWPVRYGDTGVMSFMISHDGQLYQKDLGPNTNAIARGMKRFEPDSSWKRVDAPRS